jgi:hypothetical protein
MTNKWTPYRVPTFKKTLFKFIKLAKIGYN